MRYDAADGLYWMRVRAYDPTIGRFISSDPLGRAPLFFSDQPYAYVGNNPVSNVDPSGQYRGSGQGVSAKAESGRETNKKMAGVQTITGCEGDKKCLYWLEQAWQRHWLDNANAIRDRALKALDGEAYKYLTIAYSIDVLSEIADALGAFDDWDMLVSLASSVTVILASLLPALGHWLEDENWHGGSIYGIMGTIAAGVGALMGLINSTMAAFRLGQAIMVMVSVIKLGIAGIPGLVWKLLLDVGRILGRLPAQCSLPWRMRSSYGRIGSVRWISIRGAGYMAMAPAGRKESRRDEFLGEQEASERAYRRPSQRACCHALFENLR